MDRDERLRAIVTDSPLNDEPFTPDQEAAIEELMSRPIEETEEELLEAIRGGPVN
jgi:hypothetical protein